MGLNVNYNLLVEGNNSTYHIPEYRQSYVSFLPTNEEFMMSVSEFCQEIRESRQFLSTLYETESVNESTAAVNIINGIKSVIDRVKKAVMAFFARVIAVIKKIIDAIEKKAAGLKDKIETKYRYHERVSMLKKALGDASAEDKTVSIGDIVPTKELMDKNFPDASVIGSSLVRMAMDTMHDYSLNIIQKDGADGSMLPDTELKSSESFVDYMESEKEGMLSKIFGKYEYDPTAVLKSANEVAEKAFGSSEKKDTPLTVELYGQACDNMDRSTEIIREMSSFHDDLVKNYNAIMRELDEISKGADYLDKKYLGNNSLGKERYYEASRTIITRINRVVNVIQEVVCAAFTLANHKAGRVYQIFGSAGDSARVKRACHSLINKHIGTEEVNEASKIATPAEAMDIVAKALEKEGFPAHVSKNGEWGFKRFISRKEGSLCLGSFGNALNKAYKVAKEAAPEGYTVTKDDHYTLFLNGTVLTTENFDVVNGREAGEEFYQLQDNYNASLVMMDEAFLEESYTGQLMTAICEAEGDQQQNNNQQPQATENVAQKTNIVKKTGQAVLEWVKNLIGKLGQTWQRFKNRVEELWIKNVEAKIFWEKNRDKIQNLQFNDTTVNDWYNYDLPAFGKSTIVPFEVTSEDLKSDEALQNAIMKKITTNLPAFDEKDSFTQKINKIYQGEYVKDDNNPKLLKNTKFDKDGAFIFVDDLSTKGFGSDALGKAAEDYKAIDTAHKNLSNNYQTNLAKLKGTQSVQNAENSDNQKTEPQNAAAIEENDFRFNLAECFGLGVYHEAEINVGPEDSKANGSAEESDGSNKELDAIIKRWFNFNTIAVTAKLTNALAAYKQYMSLYRNALGKKAPKKEEENKTEDQKPTQESAVLNERGFGRHFEHIETRQEKEIHNDDKDKKAPSMDSLWDLMHKTYDTKTDTGHDDKFYDKSLAKPMNESTNEADPVTVNFNGKTFQAKVYIRDDSKDLASKIDTCVKNLNNSSLFDYLYKYHKDFFDDINDDPYFDGKKIKSGADLKRSIKKIDTIACGRGAIYISGEYWCDDEHGFAIVFPGGKFIKSKYDKYNYERDQGKSVGYKYQCTVLDQHSSAII